MSSVQRVVHCPSVVFTSSSVMVTTIKVVSLSKWPRLGRVDEGLFLFRDIPRVGVNDDSVSNLKDSAEALFFFPSPLPVAFRA